VINDQNQFVPYYIVNQASIAERLAPLIGLNFQTLEKMNGRIDYSIERQVVLNTTNAQITELRTQSATVGLGYTTNRFKVPFRIGGEQRILRNELNVRLDLSIRDNTTVQRSIVDIENPTNATDTGSPGVAQQLVTNGNLQLQMRPTIDYMVNQRINLQFYFTRNMTKPRPAITTFKTVTSEGGVQLRFSLGQ
jgi:cell surface protein SprA